MRELTWYENPFGTGLVLLGDMGFVLLVMFILTALGYAVEKRLPTLAKGDIVGMMNKYSAIALGFLLWSFFTSPIVVSFVKYESEPYGLFMIILGVIFYLASFMILYASTLNIVPEEYLLTSLEVREGIIAWLSESKVEWKGVVEFFKSILAGYTCKIGLLVDMVVMVVISCSTLIDDCSSLGILTVVIDLLYCVFVLWWKPIQPLAMAYSNVAFSLGQALGIILYIVELYDVAGTIIVYASSLVGFGFLFVPIIDFFKDYCRKSEPEDEFPFLKELEMELSRTDTIPEQTGAPVTQGKLDLSPSHESEPSGNASGTSVLGEHGVVL